MKIIIEICGGKVENVYSDVDKIPDSVGGSSSALVPGKIEVAVMNWDWIDKETEDACLELDQQRKEMFLIY